MLSSSFQDVAGDTSSATAFIGHVIFVKLQGLCILFCYEGADFSASTTIMSAAVRGGVVNERARTYMLNRRKEVVFSLPRFLRFFLHAFLTGDGEH